MEDDRDCHEEAEEDELDRQPTHHDSLAGHFGIVICLDKEASAWFEMSVAHRRLLDTSEVQRI